MFSSISWSQFLTFLTIVVFLYYVVVFIRGYGVPPKAAPSRPQSINEIVPIVPLTVTPVHPSADKPLMIPSGVMHEIKLHLQHLALLGLTRKEMLDSIRSVISRYPREMDDMGRTVFLAQLKRALYAMSSISLTEDEANAFWNEQASPTADGLQPVNPLI